LGVIPDPRTGANLDPGMNDDIAADQNIGADPYVGAQQQARRQIGGLEGGAAHCVDTSKFLDPAMIGGMLAVTAARKWRAMRSVVGVWTAAQSASTRQPSLSQ
jgi:hypothetical protein